MKRVILISFILLLINQSFSKCSTEGIRVWPSGEAIQNNSLILIEGYSSSQKIIKGLTGLYPVYLKSDSEIIHLEIIEKCEGEMQLTQALLKPARLLILGEEYELIIENLPEPILPIYSLLRRYNPKSKQQESIKWICKGLVDSIPPKWICLPEYIESQGIQMGCGPTEYVIFGFEIQEESEILIKTKVTHKESRESFEYYITPTYGAIHVGHGMCSGPFMFKDLGKYEISFQIMDMSGNEAYLKTDGYVIEVPKMNQ